MTKKDFKLTAIKYARNGALLSLATLFEDFYKKNVCIPKGGVLQAKFNSGWGDILEISDKYEYRIKPSEPIYEYFVVDDKGITDWMTIREFESDNDFKFIAEKTKRIRK